MLHSTELEYLDPKIDIKERSSGPTQGIYMSFNKPIMAPSKGYSPQKSNNLERKEGIDVNQSA